MSLSPLPPVKEKLANWLFSILCFAVLFFFVYLSILANSDLVDGRFALFMDERITFDGASRILHPEGIRHFFDSILNGGDHRYGRILWNSIAIFSALPERLFGEAGQIFATRMLQVTLIISSYCIFSFGILRNWFLRFVLLIVILAMPFSGYYMTMPKPEPIQLLFLSIFCYFFIRYNAKFSWYWIFAGLAFGTKISTLPALIVFISISLAINLRKYGFESCKKPITNSIKFFSVGLAIAVPILLVPLLIIAGGYRAFNWINKKIVLSPIIRGLLATLWIFILYFSSRKIFSVWFSSTFLNTTHGADQASINAISWISYLLKTWLIAPPIVGVILILSILVYLAINTIQILRLGKLHIDKRTTAIAIAIAGLSLNVAIAIGTKRLWGFYLYPGMILMIVGTLLLIDLNISRPLNKERRPQKDLKFTAGFFISSFLLFTSGLYWTPKTINDLKAMSLRTQTADYSLQYSSYQKYLTYLDNYTPPNGNRTRVMFTPSLFIPRSNDKFEIIEFWGPYTAWDKKPDIIIFGAINTPKGQPTAKDSPEYNDFLIEREGYAAHVAEKGKPCKSQPCFIRELELPNGGEVLILSQGD